MSEKNMVTIDSELTIPKEEKKVFENQYIRLETDIECYGTLIFRNCTIEPLSDFDDDAGTIGIGIGGKLEMDGCEIIHPGKHFLYGWTMTIKNTSFLLTMPYDEVIDSYGDAQFDGCSFVEENEAEDFIPHVETEEEPTGLLKGALKLFGSAALAAAGVAATVVRTSASAVEDDRAAKLADLAGRAQDASFEKIRDMWMPDDKKDEDYCDAQAERAEFRAELAESRGSELRKQYGKEKAKFETDN